MKPKQSVLFVCLGNICRSPLAEGVFRHVVSEAGLTDPYLIDSAGLGAWHEGDRPDPRSIEVAVRHGIDVSALWARNIRPVDFTRFPHIFGMDQSNITNLSRAAPAGATSAIHLFLEFATGNPTDIPDPYYGGPDGFDNVYRTIRTASEALFEKLG